MTGLNLKDLMKTRIHLVLICVYAFICPAHAYQTAERIKAGDVAGHLEKNLDRWFLKREPGMELIPGFPSDGVGIVHEPQPAIHSFGVMFRKKTGTFECSAYVLKAIGPRNDEAEGGGEEAEWMPYDRDMKVLTIGKATIAALESELAKDGGKFIRKSYFRSDEGHVAGVWHALEFSVDAKDSARLIRILRIYFASLAAERPEGETVFYPKG